MNKLKIGSISLLALCLAACGGGGGGGDSGSATPPVTPPTSASLTGTLYDSAVAGASYSTSSGLAGTTDGAGHFHYNAGDTVTFKIGNVTLGSVKAASLITPLDLSSANFNTLNNLLVLLQSLDNHSNANALTITPDAIAKLTTALDLNASSNAFAAQLQSLSITPVPLTTALANFQTALSRVGNISGSSVSDLQKAKDFVDTSNEMISSINTVIDTYKPTNLINTSELAFANSAVGSLAENAYTQSAGGAISLTTTQIQNLLNKPYSDLYSNLNGLTVSASSNGTVTINGSFQAALYKGVNCTYNGSSYTCVPRYATPFTITVQNYVVKTTGYNSNRYGFTLASGSQIGVTTANGSAQITANSNSTLSINYPTANTLENQATAGEVPNSASLAMQNISYSDGITILSLDQLEVQAAKIQYTTGTSSSVQTGFIPTSIGFSGHVQQSQNLATVSAQVQLNNFSSTKIYALDKQSLPLSSGAEGSFSLAVSTDIVAGGKTNTFNANLIGNLAYPAASASLQLSVNGNSLTGAVNYTRRTAQPYLIALTLAHPNGSSISVADIHNFTSSDILVNGIRQGTISKSSKSLYQAFFTDNSIKVLAP